MASPTKGKLRVLSMLAVCVLLCECAIAEIVTIQVEGVVDDVLTTGPYALDGSVEIGTLMRGFFEYDSEAMDITPPGAPVFYPLISITMTIGNYTFSHDAGAIEPAIFEIYGQPRYVVRSEAPRFDGTIMIDGAPGHFEDVQWWMSGFHVLDTYSSYTEYFQTTDLPTAETFPPFWAFDVERTFRVGFNDGSDYFGIGGELTNVFVIPEPASILLLGLGAMALLKTQPHCR